MACAGGWFVGCAQEQPAGSEEVKIPWEVQHIWHSIKQECKLWRNTTVNVWVNVTAWVQLDTKRHLPGSGAVAAPEAHTCWFGQPAQASALPASSLFVPGQSVILGVFNILGLLLVNFYKYTSLCISKQLTPIWDCSHHSETKLFYFFLTIIIWILKHN